MGGSSAAAGECSNEGPSGYTRYLSLFAGKVVVLPGSGQDWCCSADLNEAHEDPGEKDGGRHYVVQRRAVRQEDAEEEVEQSDRKKDATPPEMRRVPVPPEARVRRRTHQE